MRGPERPTTALAPQVGFVLAGHRVLDWLLDAAAASPGSPEQLSVRRFLALVLSDGGLMLML